MVTLPDGSVVPADDPRVILIQQPAPPPPPPETFTRDQLDQLVIERVEAARREEKEKLYGTINTLDERVKVFETERQRLADEAQAALDAQAETERLRQQEEQTLAERLQASETRWEQQFNEQQQSIAQKEALWQKEREFQQIATYRNTRLAELKDQIDPRFNDFVGGTTPEEIEASLYIAAEKTAQIGQEFQTWAEQQGMVPGGQQQVRRPTVPVTSGPGFTPEQLSGGVTERTLTPEDIANMPMSEFAANREQLLAAASRQVQERGLYG